jgi:hypothetical protein
MHSFALDVMSTSESSQRREIEARRTRLYRTVSTAPTVNDGIKDYKLVHTSSQGTKPIDCNPKCLARSEQYGKPRSDVGGAVRTTVGVMIRPTVPRRAT